MDEISQNPKSSISFLLDTNICVYYLRGKFDLEAKLTNIGIQNCAISEITLAELVYGAEFSANPKKNLDLIEQFSNQIMILPIINSIYIYAKEKARLRSAGTMISDFDLLIGCTALEKGMILVTENVKEFNRIQNLKIENWIERN